MNWLAKLMQLIQTKKILKKIDDVDKKIPYPSKLTGTPWTQ